MTKNNLPTKMSPYELIHSSWPNKKDEVELLYSLSIQVRKVRDKESVDHMIESPVLSNHLRLMINSSLKDFPPLSEMNMKSDDLQNEKRIRRRFKEIVYQGGIFEIRERKIDNKLSIVDFEFSIKTEVSSLLNVDEDTVNLFYTRIYSPAATLHALPKF